MLGSTVSHYKILEKIGEGGMGEVYLAEDTKLQRKVSLKFLAEELTRDKERKQRFVQEARAAASVEHPHIAAIYDIDEAEGRTFIAMEYVRGENLRTAIDAGKLNLRRSLELGFQVADGLAKAHERGVVHRDIKPENILVSEDGYAKIIDFGLAKLFEPLTQTSGTSAEMETKLKTKDGLVMGTVAYMSPEQARGESVDARTDVFSFGAVLYEMLTGQSTFRKGSVAESLSAVLNQTPRGLDRSSGEIPADLQRVMRKALAKEPTDRYQSMKDLAIDLRELKDEMTGSARPAGVSLTESKSRLAVVAAVALAGLVAGWFFFGRDQTPPGIGASGRPAVAVMYFESMSGDEEIRWLSQGLPNMLVTDLAQTPGLDVVSSRRIHEILKRIGQEDLESIDKSVVAEVAREAGAGAVVVGSIFKSGDEIRIDVQVEDVGSGRVLSAESVRGNDVFPLVDELTGRIRASLEVGDLGGRPIAEITTPSLEAYQLYTEGYQAQLNVRYADAREAFERAVAIDPSFAMAHVRLSELAGTRGETSLAREYNDKAYQNRDRLTERQELYVRGQRAFFENNLEQAAELANELVDRYPDEELGYLTLSVLYRALQRPDEATAVAERGVKELPQFGPLYNMYGYALLDEGRYPEALRALETYARLDPNEANPHDSLGEAYLISGQPEKALTNYELALELNPSFHVSRIGRTYAYGVLGRYDDFLAEAGKLVELSDRIGFPPAAFYFLRALGLSRVGRYREAEEAVQEGIVLARGLEDREREGALVLLSALHALELGRYSETLVRARRAEDLVPQMDHPLLRPYTTVLTSLVAGTAQARSGDLQAARTQLEEQRQVMDNPEQGQVWWHHVLEGEIALASGDFAAGEAAFLTGEPAIKMPFSFGANPGIIGTMLMNAIPFHDGLARVKKAKGDLNGAISIYRDLLTPDMGSKWTAWLEPRYVLALARLLDETGDTEGAGAEYQRFLDLWKNADEGLPELEEARAYLAR